MWYFVDQRTVCNDFTNTGAEKLGRSWRGESVWVMDGEGSRCELEESGPLYRTIFFFSNYLGM